MQSGPDNKPRLCFALPGINYADVTSNVIPARALATALDAHFDVTFVARSFVEAPPSHLKTQAVLEEPLFPAGLTGAARATFLGRTIGEELDYLRALDRFARDNADRFDVVIERQWRYAGVLTAAFKRQGVAAGFCSEGEIFLRHPPPWTRNPRRRAGHETLRLLARQARRAGMRHGDFVICETAELASQMRATYGARFADKLSVTPPGVNGDVFRPADRATARRALGISPDTFLLIYVGALNGSIQCPGHVIEGLARSGRTDAVLHIIGTGDRAEARKLEAEALGAPVVFHGHKRQADAAAYIAAADLCVAPYRRNFYPHREFTSASCKVSEYLASSRAVMTIPCSRMEFLTDGGRFGFLVENSAEAYRVFLANVSRATIMEKEARLSDAIARGELAQTGRVIDWDEVAARYARTLMAVAGTRDRHKRAFPFPPSKKETKILMSVM